MRPERAVLALRKPVDPAAAEAFLTGQPVPAPVVVPLEPHDPTMHVGRRVHERKDGRKVRRTTVLMDLELARRVDLYAAQQGIDKTAVMHAALERWLSERDA